MSDPEAAANSHGTEKLPAAEKEDECGEARDDQNTHVSSRDRSQPDTTVRDRVLKEVGQTSTAFIGPAFPPGPSNAKLDIEDSLSEFYKELEKIDPPEENDVTQVNTQQQTAPGRDIKKEFEGKDEYKHSWKGKETSSYPRNGGPTRSSWQHECRSEPYQRMPRKPGMDVSATDPTQRFYSQPGVTPPPLRMHMPSFPHQTNSGEFPCLRDQTSQINCSSDTPRKIPFSSPQNHFPPFSNHPPQNSNRHPVHDFYPDCPQQSCSSVYDPHSRQDFYRREEYEERCEGAPTFDEEHEMWLRQHPPEPGTEEPTYCPSLVLVLMRGLPGSGKSTLARELVSRSHSGIILSTDDYFAQNNGYQYDPFLLGTAHEWNQNRADKAMYEGISPIIIDNTNLQAWEMKPYVIMALERGYIVEFREPETSWKFDPYELEKRNTHGVDREKIAQMMGRISSPISIDIVLNSQEPLHVLQRRRQEEKNWGR